MNEEVICGGTPWGVSPEMAEKWASDSEKEKLIKDAEKIMNQNICPLESPYGIRECFKSCAWFTSQGCSMKVQAVALHKIAMELGLMSAKRA